MPRYGSQPRKLFHQIEQKNNIKKQLHRVLIIGQRSDHIQKNDLNKTDTNSNSNLKSKLKRELESQKNEKVLSKNK